MRTAARPYCGGIAHTADATGCVCGHVRARRDHDLLQRSGIAQPCGRGAGDRAGNGRVDCRLARSHGVTDHAEAREAPGATIAPATDRARPVGGHSIEDG